MPIPQIPPRLIARFQDGGWGSRSPPLFAADFAPRLRRSLLRVRLRLRPDLGARELDLVAFLVLDDEPVLVAEGLRPARALLASGHMRQRR